MERRYLAIFSLLFAVVICFSGCSSKSSEKNGITITKTDKPVYPESISEWKWLSQRDILTNTDVIFEGKYTGSDYCTLEYKGEEQYFTILKFDITDVIAGNISGKSVSVSMKNNNDSSREKLEFEKGRAYIVMAGNIEHNLGDIPVKDSDFPSEYITVSDQFVFTVSADEVYITEYILDFTESEKDLYDTKTISTFAGDAERYIIEKDKFKENLNQLYKYYKPNMQEGIDEVER